MSTDPKSFADRPLSDVEIRRLESEIAKNEAEQKKLTFEAEEAERRLRRKWYSGRVLVQAVVGALLSLL